MRTQFVATAFSVVIVSFSGFATAQESASSREGIPAVTERPSIETVDLGTIYPGVWTEPRAINERAMVVGVAQFPDGSQHAFLWTRHTGFSEIVHNGGATDINNRGDIVGYLNTSGNYRRGFLWSERRGLHDLGEFIPYAINESGDMAGQCERELPQPCALINGIVHQIDVEHYGLAADINNRGIVIGSTYQFVEDAGFAPQAFTWSLSLGLRLLDTGDTYTTEPQAINSAGVIAGTASFTSPTPERGILQAARWQKQSFEILEGSSWTSAAGVNDRGWIVGVVWEGGSSPGAARPLLWVPENVAIELPAPEGLQGYYAADVTNSGLVVGAAYKTTEGLASIHGVLWIVKRGSGFR